MKKFNNRFEDDSTTFSPQTHPTTSNITTGDLLRDAFLEFDRNSDGFISKDELRSVMSSFGYQVTSEELDAMVRKLVVYVEEVLVRICTKGHQKMYHPCITLGSIAPQITEIIVTIVFQSRMRSGTLEIHI